MRDVLAHPGYWRMFGCGCPSAWLPQALPANAAITRACAVLWTAFALLALRYWMRYNEHMDRTIILYHANCADGFSGAYAAWKKFGDTAEYIGLSHGKTAPENLAGATLYFVDFCYPQPIMDELVAAAKHVVVLDHHLGMKEVVERMPEYVFDENRSGATIAWTYFHPKTPIPTFLTYVEDDDLFRFALPETKAVLAYISVLPFSFETWDTYVATLENETEREVFLSSARSYREYFDLLAEHAVRRAKLVMFEGHECLFANAHPFMPMQSTVGNLLVQQLPPIGIVASAHPEGMGVSLRSDGSIDVAEIARKYGGNGHPRAAGFQLTWGASLPWSIVEKDETAGNRN